MEQIIINVSTILEFSKQNFGRNLKRLQQFSIHLKSETCWKINEFPPTGFNDTKKNKKNI